MTTLSTLPNEILSLITSHFDRPSDLLHLSLTSHRLTAFAKLDGWKAFLKGRFCISGLDLDAANSVHGLTTLYRNWERKGFVARYLEPTKNTRSLNTWAATPWRGPQGQTMGYQPSIDSYEDMFGAWSERREVLAWSAGTQIVMRVKETGARGRAAWAKQKELESEPDQTFSYDALKNANSWFSYKIPESVEGRDDITSLRLLRPHQTHDTAESIVFGTASGQLSRLTVYPDRAETVEQQYDTTRRAIESISVSPFGEPLLAATLGDSSLALFPLHDDNSETPVGPITQVTPSTSGPRTSRIWSCDFLSDDKVAIGMGPSHEPIHVYQITPEGFLSSPLRTFNLDPTSWDNTSSTHAPLRSTSIYPLLPLRGSTTGGSDAGTVFLSGGYDGIVRLHDTRSRRGFETLFWDPPHDSSIYSLAVQGHERIVAGVSMHAMLKVFDLRLSGSHAYQSIPLPGSTPTTNPNPSSPQHQQRKPPTQDFASNAIVTASKGRATAITGGWNLYLHARSPPARGAYRDDYWRGRDDSPVYALSIPSPTSPAVYAGLEGAVMGLTFHGVQDAWADGMLTGALGRDVNGAHDGATNGTRNETSNGTTTNDTPDTPCARDDAGVLNLGMYEQGSEEGLGMQLLVQSAVGATPKRGDDAHPRYALLDERWRDIREEGNRWARGGAQAQPQAGRGARGGRGRGRGRGRRARG